VLGASCSFVRSVPPSAAVLPIYTGHDELFYLDLRFPKFYLLHRKLRDVDVHLLAWIFIICIFYLIFLSVSGNCNIQGETAILAYILITVYL